MPCLMRLGLAFLINFCRQHLLEQLHRDFANQLNFEEFMTKVGFYVVQLHQLVEIQQIMK
jgi:hypothetical protein